MPGEFVDGDGVPALGRDTGVLRRAQAQHALVDDEALFAAIWMKRSGTLAGAVLRNSSDSVALRGCRRTSMFPDF